MAVLLTMLVIIAVLVWAVFRSENFSPIQRLPIIPKLEGFYIGNGLKWDGVTEVFSNEMGNLAPEFWEWNYLLDKNDIVLIGNKSGDTNLPGQTYTRSLTDFPLTLYVNDEPIGRIVFNASSLPSRLRVVGSILAPVAGISLFLAVFLIISNYFLIRRIINPLSLTIAAAKEVAEGNLNARVQVNGPDDLKVLNETFNQMVASLEETTSQRREFLADIAHELRTPLTIIRGRLEGIMDGIYTADEANISSIMQETFFLERLVDDLRTLTLAETRQLQFDCKCIDLAEIINTSITAFAAQAEENRISIEFTPTGEPVTAFADPQRIEQVIRNIIANSFRYMHQDGHIFISLAGTGKSTRITISDDGPGVEEADLPHLFDRFWRKEKSRSRSTGGSGLGLAISQQLVAAQGGKIIAGRHLPSGLTLTIDLPAGKPD
jgi:two-component system OmpR family sensor kinase/two-component system sensor histidine kinase BaeS